MMRRTFLSWLALWTVLGATFCTPATRPGSDAASPPSLLILGSAEPEYVRGMARAFELEAGIPTSYMRLSAGEALDRVRSERQAPPFSVWWGGSADNYIAADADGLLEPYQPVGSTKIPRAFKDESGHWTGVYVGVLGLAVNYRALAERGLTTPSTWADLTQPMYRREIAMAHPGSSGTAYTALATLAQLSGRDIDRALAYFKALDANIRVYPRAGAEPARLAGRGDVAIGIAFSHDIVRAIDDGAPDLRVVFPGEGTGYEIGAMALIKNAPHPTEAKRFMDWALSERAQELGPLFTAYQIPTNPDAKVPPKSARLSAINLISYDFRWAGEHRTGLTQAFATGVAPKRE